MEHMEKWYLHGLLLIPSLTPKIVKELFLKYNSFEAIWKMDEARLRKETWPLDETTIQDMILRRDTIDIEKEKEKCERDGIGLVSIYEESYPPLLKEISTPPLLLYVRGKVWDEGDIPLAVVGTRNYSVYGKEVTPPLVRDLAHAGITVVSGMARGIDTFAHRAALEAGGRTVAILGSGVDQKSLYPSQNRILAEEIIKGGGAVVSEFPPGTMPLPHHFPQRNRIIAGMSLGVVVMEAPKESGALITATFSLDANREVFAVPGHIFSKTSRGTHALIQRGAKLVEDADDILEELAPFVKTGERDLAPRKIHTALCEEEKTIWEIFEAQATPLHIDDIARRTTLPVNTTASTLTIMELRGLVTRLGKGMYTIKR